MHNPYYEMTVPLFIKSLTQVDHLLKTAEKFVLEQGMQESDILEARLAPDMFPFVKQVQITCDNAKGSSARLAGIEAPVMMDDEASIPEVRARVAKTLAFLESLTAEQFADAADRKVELPYFKDKHFKGNDFLTHYALPNFYFHFVTIYAILRMKGMQIGKADYAGMLPLQDNILA